jgi:signal transduction histidine kinase
MDHLTRTTTNRWLHDRTLQVLQYMAAGGYRDEPDAEHLSAVAATAAAELRDFIDGRSHPAPEGLAAALDEVVAEARALAPALDIRLVVGPIDVEPDAHTTVELAAATGEALTNVRRHSGAQHVLVRCHVERGQIAVAVTDDGVGFVPSRQTARHGIRHSMQGRMADLGGSATIMSRGDGGTTVAFVLDLQPGRSCPSCAATAPAALAIAA